jgi:hypothetical protein
MASGFDLTATARSLLNIEVNTIVRDNMTAEPMPPMPHALLDIACSYADTLCGLGVDLARYFGKDSGDPEAIVLGWIDSPAWIGASLTVSDDTFNRLRWAADRANSSVDPRGRIPAAKRVLLERIINNADAIKELFKRLGTSMDQFKGKTRAELIGMTIRSDSYVVAPDDLILLQKIWDIGVEEIVAQTVVYVNGAITTRVQEALRRPGSEPLFAIHRQSVDVSVGCWKYLLDVVREIAGTTVRMLLGVKG